MKFLFYFNSCLLMLSGFAGHTQVPADYGFQQVTNAPCNSIFDVYIDRKGFVWIGHELGLSRFDGMSFTSYHHPLQSSLAMSNLSEDSKGRLWSMNFDGQLFYIEHDRMHLFQDYKPDLNLSTFVIVNDELLAKSSKGLFVLDLNTNKTKVITSFADTLPLSRLEDLLYSYGHQALFLVALKDKWGLMRYINGRINLLKPAFKYPFNLIAWADDQQIIMRSSSLNDELTSFQVRGDSLILQKAIPLKGSMVYSRSSKAHNTIWIHALKQSKALQSPEEINNLSLTKLIEDREGNTWASSLVYGLLLKKRESQWTLNPVNKNASYITCFGFFANKIIASKSNGDLLIADSVPQFYNGRHQTVNLGQKFNAGFVSGTQLCAYGAPRIFMLNQRFEVVQRVNRYANNASPNSMDHNINLFSTKNGIVALPIDPQQHHPVPGLIATHFDYSVKGKCYISKLDKRVRGIYYDTTQKILYAGFSNGLYAYTATQVKEIKFKNFPIYAYDIKRHDSLIYIATLSSGVLILKNNEVIGQLNGTNGLLSSTILSLKMYNNHLWILGADEVQLYDMERKGFMDSIVLPPVKGAQVFDMIEHNGKAYFSTIEGIYSIPFSKGREDVLPLNYLLSVIVNSTDTIRDGASLSYKKNSLLFNLVGLYYFNPNGVYFSYRLSGSGMDTSWKYSPQGQNKIIFPYIMPGHYTFEAVAYTANGLKAAQKIAFSFTIQKPLWRQSWFLLSIAGLIAGLSYLFIYMRIQNRKKANQLIIEKLEYESAANESELKALKSQMNPHFIFNSLNTIQEMFMWGDKNAANEQLANFAMLTRLILTVSGKKTISLSTEIDILKKYLTLEKMRFQESFSYEILVEEGMDEGYTQIPPMIIQPFVENSIKHGLLHKAGEKILRIHFRETPEYDYVICTITDNGIGRKKSAELNKVTRHNHNSFSIEAIQKRLDLMRKEKTGRLSITYTDLEDENGRASGTTVSIVIPTFIT